ncbi:hypothetical protein QBC35DRAFT_501591 [Podospora australis]|uniref:T6SS Phospholipase effector Tle1-like catalytic domain-containing protein n=1 Tax=Podospora australis TaxID=1536484 RepID=A0AAN6WU15_9PEZI|nr:hypothetical protein QBC35DRAFT_501591 [Podospora australis]
MDKMHLTPGRERHARVASAERQSVNQEEFHSTHQPSRPATPMAEKGSQARHRKPRKLVLCFDGTGNKFHGDDSDSNILKIFRMLDRTASDQFHYYQPGIGTYVISNSLTRTSTVARFKSWYQKSKDSAIGSSFDHHVVGGYRFLMRFYNTGDEIYIFGFSRGAYVARFLAEMLDYVGLLSHGNEELVSFAWKAFSNWQSRQGHNTPGGSKKKKEMYTFMKGFRETFSRPVRRIRFLGLFDTVNSVPRFETAFLQRSKYPYTARTSAKVVRHAVSIDERRAKFRQDLMYQSGGKSSKEAHPATHKLYDIHEKYRRKSVAPAKMGQGSNSNTDRGRRETLNVEAAPYRRSHSKGSRQTRLTDGSGMDGAQRDDKSEVSVAPHPHDEEDSLAETEDESDQDIDEVWFAGGHADIGGGWEEELADSKAASHVPLVWMVHEAMKAGLHFDVDKVREMGCLEALHGEEEENAAREKQDRGDEDIAPHDTSIPNIMVRSSSMSTPKLLQQSSFKDSFNGNASHSEGSKEKAADKPLTFREMMHRAHTARIHDSLEFDCGLSKTSVLAWKIMEYLPFRRMDLQSDGSWKPIRWPLPGGEVRDIPDGCRVHGSVIRRMQTDPKYRPGNLIIGGGGRGVRVAGEEHGMGDWVCVQNDGCPIGEIFMKSEEVEKRQNGMSEKATARVNGT